MNVSGASPHMTAADDAYAQHKATPATLAAIGNLRKRASRYRYALGPSPSTRCGTVVVCGAGPSLHKSADLIRNLHSSGASIFTVNTAHAAVADIVTPDVVVCREAIDVSAHLGARARAFVLDLAANEAAWERAESIGVSLLWFVAGGLQWFELAATLGVRPLFGGPASLTSCVSLAEQWGASRIVLCGVDLAFAEDGSGYAEGSAFAGYRGTLTGDHVSLGGAGYEAMRAQSDAASIAPPPQRQNVVRVEAYGGGPPVVALYTWADQIRWLETFAARWGGEIDCVDATGGGARKRGWRECADVAPPIERMRRAFATVPDSRITAALADIARQCDTTRSIAGSSIDPDGAVVGVPHYLRGCDVVEAVAAGALVTMRKGPRRTPREGVKAVARVLMEAAETVSAVASTT